jgi:hypothetical protein
MERVMMVRTIRERTDLLADLVDEDEKAVGPGQRGGQLAERLAHQPSLATPRDTNMQLSPALDTNTHLSPTFPYHPYSRVPLSQREAWVVNDGCYSHDPPFDPVLRRPLTHVSLCGTFAISVVDSRY